LAPAALAPVALAPVALALWYARSRER